MSKKSKADPVLAERINTLLLTYGSFRDLGKALGVTHTYLWRLRAGQLLNPSKSVLDKLGLKRVVTYKKVSQ